MVHVLNLDIQGGLKELGNPSSTVVCLENEEVEECEEDVMEVRSERVFGAILC